MPDLTEWSEQRRELRLKLEEQIVDLLDKAPGFQEESARSRLAARAAQYAGEPLGVPESSLRRLWLFGLVEECIRLRRGLSVLGESVRDLLGRSGLSGDLAHLIDSWYTVDTAATAVIPWRDSGPAEWAGRDRETQVRQTRVVDVWAELRASFAKKQATDVQREFRYAVGDRRTTPPWYCDTAWKVFVHLVNWSALPGLLPPYLVFLDRLLHGNQLDRDVEPLVEAWVRRVATEHGCLVDLEALRARRADESSDRLMAHLVMRVRGSGPSPGRYDLSWYLERYPPREVLEGGDPHERLGRAELEGAVSSVVRQAERTLSHTHDELALEFVLPFDLLDLHVEWWQKEQRYGPDQPLALDYSVTLRSLEREEEREWHRVWRARWQPTGHPAAVVTYWCNAMADFDGRQLKAELQANEQLMTLVLSEPPRLGNRGMDELLVGLSAGMAGFIWRRADNHAAAETDERLRDCLREHRVAELPRAAHRLRLDSQQVPTHARHRHLGRQIALLWDDPLRLDVPEGNGP
ncbi:conserved hypothetical protein [Frankia sp. AiPs1]|uniref:VMAP-C domain-containing protein n=1 Tax=Frankia sp. AiPa1 TaxID=573492 RepID=UPI00202AE948|nr:hypothetical protein [Frankia sp. AiPa1]MCL9758898.1 hypothetical protein [Frankia sp. AiPa1]